MQDTVQLGPTDVVGFASPAGTACSVDQLWTMADSFTAWLDASGYGSYDPYDIWGTGYGRVARRLYYQKHLAGKLLVAPVVMMEILAPQLRRALVRKDRYPTADAQLVLAYLNLYQLSQDRELATAETARKGCRSHSPEWWLSKAENLAAELLVQSVPGYRGHCWGYPFDWQNVNGLMPKGTPHITATPYCYEAFTRLAEVTGDSSYLAVAKSIIVFVDEDLRDTATGPDSAASSYTPYDDGKVVNASAYRAFLLFDAAYRFQNDSFLDKAWKNLRFILDSQREDGSWLYAVDNPAEAFIDHFHTCFVLKNLYKLNLLAQSDEVSQALRRGYSWYRSALFDDEDNPRCFARAPRLETVRLEMYNVAEAITLGVLLKEDVPEAFALAQSLAAKQMLPNQLAAGHWVTRIYLGGIRHTVPFLRWPQAQLFLALTNLLTAVEAVRS